MDLLIFKLGGVERFAVDVLGILEIMKPAKLHTIPGSHASVMGCINVRGKTVPVMNLNSILFADRPAIEEMLIVLDRTEPFAFSVGQIDQILKVSDAQMEDLQRGEGGRYVEGVFKGQDGALIQVINIEKILRVIKN